MGVVKDSLHKPMECFASPRSFHAFRKSSASSLAWKAFASVQYATHTLESTTSKPCVTRRMSTAIGLP